MLLFKLVSSAILHSYLYIFFFYMCVFPLIEDKQRFKFVDVMSILKNHFIPMFYLVF